jgi:polyferredoxin
MSDMLTRIRDLVTSRWFVKGAFFVFFVYTVAQLFRFVAWAKGTGPEVHRPEAPAGILPIGHFTSFFAWVRGGGWDTLLPAGLVLILMALTVSLLFKRGFCGWICPVGTVWEGFSAVGRRLMGRDFRLPRWLDFVGRGFRYLIAAGFMGILLIVPLAEAVDFRTLPYMWVADIKILRMMGDPLYVLVVLTVGAVSMFVGPLWCRYLCPLGGLYSAVGVASPCTIERDAETCIHCSKCTKVCHAFVAPENTKRVLAPECDGCMDCVKACPVEGCLEAKAFGRVRIAPWAWPLLVVGVWLAIYGVAKLTGHWDSTIPSETFKQVINSGLLEQKTKGFF